MSLIGPNQKLRKLPPVPTVLISRLDEMISQTAFGRTAGSWLGSATVPVAVFGVAPKTRLPNSKLNGSTKGSGATPEPARGTRAPHHDAAPERGRMRLGCRCYNVPVRRISPTCIISGQKSPPGHRFRRFSSKTGSFSRFVGFLGGWRRCKTCFASCIRRFARCKTRFATEKMPFAANKLRSARCKERSASEQTRSAGNKLCSAAEKSCFAGNIKRPASEKSRFARNKTRFAAEKMCPAAKQLRSAAYKSRLAGGSRPLL
jgi:hypothetical protein